MSMGMPNLRISQLSLQIFPKVKKDLRNQSMTQDASGKMGEATINQEVLQIFGGGGSHRALVGCLSEHAFMAATPWRPSLLNSNGSNNTNSNINTTTTAPTPNGAT
jgi:hypothetical protein